LVLAALLGDLTAFDELVRRFRGGLILMAQQILGSRAAAEDVVQDVFLLAFKALPQLQEPSRFAGWLRAITQHRARRIAAGESRHESTEPSVMDRLILAPSQAMSLDPAAEALRREEAAFVTATVAELPPDYQQVLHLRYWAEWPVMRIAGFLSLPLTTVKWRLHHGRELLRRRLTTSLEVTTDGT
jgi:RNA polymerase sigma-70 factor (ECF subfamily)